ncbi:MAG: zinc carboxypeptidase [Planctomycetes bacterium]|nr:zinc carboxypeptidase [Planctomycetota bacterium]
MRLSQFLTLLFLFILIQSPLQGEDREAPSAERPALVRIDLDPDPQVIGALSMADMDIAYVGREGEGIQIVADTEDLDLLMRSNVPYTILYKDLIAHYESRFDMNLSKDLGYGSMGGYYKFDEVENRLDQFRSDHPNLITAKISLGQTEQGRNIWAVKISDNPDQDEDEPEAIIDSLTHAREPQGMMSTLYFMDWVLENYDTDPLAKFLVNEREMWFVPVQNPDGYYRNQQTNPHGGGMWRKNRRNNGDGSRGVDPNRNWGYMWGFDGQGSSGSPKSETYRGPSPMSEPETQAMAALISERNAVERMSIHTYGNLWLIPWGYDRIVTPDDSLLRILSDEMAPESYTVGTCWETLYTVNGGSCDWDYGDQGIMTFSPEMGTDNDGFWPSTSRIMPIAEEVLPSLQYFFAIAGAFLKMDRFKITDIAGKLNGYPDAGDRVELVVDLTNRGLGDYPDPISLSLSSASPRVNILTGTSQVPAVASRASTDNAAQPFVFEIESDTPYAESVELELTINLHGIGLKETIDFYVGTARQTAFDDMEAGVNQWFLGGKSTEGGWEWGNPYGTWIDTEPVQPEDDHTLSGVNCLCTGIGEPGAGPDDFDLDGGYAVMVSPVFNLVDLGDHPRVGMNLWWYKPEEGADGTDRLTVYISKNEGITWTFMDEFSHSGMNQWNEITFDVEDYITPSDNMALVFLAVDSKNDSTIEAAIDDFWVESYSTRPLLGLLGKLKTNATCRLNLSWDAGDLIWIYLSTGTGPGITLPGGTWVLDPPFDFLLYHSVIPDEGRVSLPLPIPDLPELIGTTFYLQSFIVPQGGGDVLISNCLEETMR